MTDPNFFNEIGPRKHMVAEMGAAFAAEGIISLASSHLYTSMADTDEVIAEALDGFESVFQGIEGVVGGD